MQLTLELPLSVSRDLNAMFQSSIFSKFMEIITESHENDVNATLTTTLHGNAFLDSQQLSMLKGQTEVFYLIDNLQEFVSTAVKEADQPLQQALEFHSHPWIADGSGENLKSTFIR